MTQGRESLPKSIQEEMQRMDGFEEQHNAQMQRDNTVSVIVGILLVLAVLTAVAFILL